MIALGLVDGIIPEPPGGAHNDHERATALVDQALSHALAEVSALSRARSGSTCATTSSAGWGKKASAFVDKDNASADISSTPARTLKR